MKFRLCFLLLFTATFALAQPVEVGVEPESGIISLEPAAFVADAYNKEIGFADVISGKSDLIFVPVKGWLLEASFTNHHFWVKTAIKNSGTTDVTYYLETARPITDIVDLYAVTLGGDTTVQHSGDAIAFDQRAFKHRKTIFKLAVKAGQTQNLFIHCKSDGEVLNLPLRLHTPDSFIAETNDYQLFFGLFYGVLLLAAITYLFFYIGLRDSSFLYYGLYVLFIGLLQFSLDGLFFQYFMPQSGWVYLRSLIIIAAISTFFLGRYAFSFLSIKQQYAKLTKAYNIVYVLTVVLILMPLMGDKGLQLSYPVANLLGFFTLILIVVSVVTLWFGKQKVDIFFAIGIFCLVMGFAIFILKNFGTLPSNFITENSTKIGTGLEIVFLSLSMANRIRLLRTEKEMIQAVALKRAEEMSDLKTYFMSNMSHELRTPLNAIMGVADVMLKEVKDDKIKNNFEVIKNASVNLLSSVSDILDYARIEKGELSLTDEVFEPLQVLLQSKNSAAMQTLHKGLEFTYIPAVDLPKNLRGDAARLGQIVNNLLSNAIKFTNAGAIRFEVFQKDTGNDRIDLMLKVTDTGVGIPKDKLDTVFNSFTQESIDNKRKFGGLGLGLSIVKKLVDLHGGTVMIESEVDKGTCCTVVLPYEVAFVESKTVTAKYPKDSFDLMGARILVVEDNDVNRFIMKTILSRWGNTEVEFAADGSLALEELAARQYDIVLMDLQMPVMDGYEASERIRKGEVGVENSKIPIIAVTADTTEEARQKVKSLGVNDFMTKPVDQHLLYEKIKLLLEAVA